MTDAILVIGLVILFGYQLSINDRYRTIERRLNHLKSIISKSDAEKEKLQEKSNRVEIKMHEAIKKAIPKPSFTAHDFDQLAFDAIFEDYCMTTKEDWMQTLVLRFANETTSIFGQDLQDILNGLSFHWENYYQEPLTGLEFTYEEWADIFNHKHSAKLFLRLLPDGNAHTPNREKFLDRYLAL